MLDARRHAGGDGFADVSRRRDGWSRWSGSRSGASRPTYGCADVVQPGVGYLTFARLGSIAEKLAMRAAVLAVARTRLAWRLRRQRRPHSAAPGAGGVRLVGGAMIVFFNPLSTTPGKQPLPLSLMSLAAVLEGREPWSLVDGNVVADPAAEIIERLSARRARARYAAWRSR